MPDPSPATPPPRRAHVVSDLPSRARKGLKIERLLNLDQHFGAGDPPFRLLDVGTGAGGISHYFARHPRLRCQVDAVDTQDNRLVTDGYAFRLVSGTALPFADAAFDVILSNHVIEHVGQRESQKHHLDELKRVLRPEGIVYLAVPNRWMLVEPHYGLAFLSWWPTSWRTPWLRLWKKGEYYDCEPLAVRELEGLLQESGFRFRNVSVEATRLFYEIEKPDALLTRGLRRMPDAVLAALRPVIPTLCYVLEKRHCSSPSRHS